MDDPADCSWTWPFWKFGLKRDDLFGALHDQYNTVSSPILDPEAFHHDVYEISNRAGTAAEFHRLLHDRKEQRLRELNETLESAAFEIIGNPSLIGKDQWQHAVQLFRTKSLDSLVRLYASYLPPGHPWYRSGDCTTDSDLDGSVGSLTDSRGSFSDDDYYEPPPMMEEPFEYPSYSKQVLPASPRSMTMCSDSSAASPIDDAHHDFDFSRATPARASSFSESEPDCCAMLETHTHCNCERESRASDFSPLGVENDDNVTTPQIESHNGDVTLPLPTSEITDSEIPTPKPEAQSASFFADTKPSPTQRRHRSLSPSRDHHPLSDSDLDEVLIAHRDPRNSQRSKLNRRGRECSPMVQRRRKNMVEPATRIQKPIPETARSRPRSRKCGES
ncbi:hypothetical protein C8A00DRAFT_35709 [Chaetomidium leptoderma]|uniref:Uncharacterized protein n=1 Tax=Chaetomidium leptoderma TaxID=669021 RepID=A0AAN6VI05_9PEZI|nr:hypothetical protein C8A00DRAFT_35709 [Chaetomidium leptoderma]